MNNLIIQDNEMKMFQTIAKYASTSGLYKGAGGEAAIFMVLLAAHDLGIKPTIALNGGIWNIQGKIEISARLMTSMIRRAGHSIAIKECNDKICTLKGKRIDNQDEIEVSFSIEDAQKAGLASRDVWKKYTEDMLYARALSRLARRLFPDVIGTAYVEGEVKDEQIKPDHMSLSTDVEIIDLQNKSSVQEKQQQISTTSYLEQKEEITDEQKKAMNELSEKCDPEYIAKVFSRLEEKGIYGFENIKKDLFEVVMVGMAANAKKFQGVKNV